MSIAIIAFERQTFACATLIWNFKGIPAFYYKQHFYKQRQAEIGKNSAKAKQHPETEFLQFENCSLSSSTLLSKNNRRYSKKCTKRIACFNDVIWLTALKLRRKMKNRSQRYDINRPSLRHGPKNILFQFMKKLSNTEAKLKNSVANKEKRVTSYLKQFFMTLMVWNWCWYVVLFNNNLLYTFFSKNTSCKSSEAQTVGKLRTI